MTKVRKRITFYGWVQGVGFRYRAVHAANAVGATGRVRNEYDGSVTMEIQGTEDMIDRETPILSQGNAWMSTKDTEYALFDELTEQGELIVKADSIEELAEKTGLSGLPATVESYNEGAADGKDEQFGRTEKLEPLTDGPFYAIRTIPYCGWAAGGPMANENMEVLREDGSVIPGLYVAGEGAGFTLVSGKTPISGMYLGMASTFGIDAAVHAAEFAQKQ